MGWASAGSKLSIPTTATPRGKRSGRERGAEAFPPGVSAARQGWHLPLGHRRRLAAFAPDGAFLGYFGSVIDIDERRQAEAAAAHLTDVVPAFVWFASPDGHLHFLNDRWCEFTGQSLEDALPDGWIEAVHPEDRARTAAVWADARAREVSYDIEVRYLRHDGACRWYQARAEPLRDAGGTVTAWFGTSTDIHDRKLAEDRLRELNETLRAASACTSPIVEPGGFRTDFAGIVDAHRGRQPAYADTVGQVAAMQRACDGTQPGDPQRAARAMMAVVSAKAPPLRLVLGSDAYARDEARLAELRAWRELSLSTDFRP